MELIQSNVCHVSNYELPIIISMYLPINEDIDEASRRLIKT